MDNFNTQSKSIEYVKKKQTNYNGLFATLSFMRFTIFRKISEVIINIIPIKSSSMSISYQGTAVNALF